MRMKEVKFAPKSSNTITLYDSVPGGFPSPATDEMKDDVNIEDYLIEHPMSSVCLRVLGDSMVGANISDGTIIVVDKARKAQVGDIVVAVVDSEYTVKYLANGDRGYYLKPANDDYDDIHPQDEMTIFGVVVAHFTKIKS